jgi:hypothetical protein
MKPYIIKLSKFKQPDKLITLKKTLFLYDLGKYMSFLFVLQILFQINISKLQWRILKKAYL